MLQSSRVTTRRKRAVSAARKSLVAFTAAHCRTDEAPAEQQEIKVVTVDKQTGAVHIIHAIAYKANVARPICAMLLGEDHPVKYKMATGVGVMVVGVTIAKLFGHSGGVVSYAADLIGYAVHGLGLTPFIEHLAHRIKEAKK